MSRFNLPPPPVDINDDILAVSPNFFSFKISVRRNISRREQMSTNMIQMETVVASSSFYI